MQISQEKLDQLNQLCEQDTKRYEARMDKIPKPAIEYCITAGPGRLIDFGVCEGEMSLLHDTVECMEVDDKGRLYGRWREPTTLHIAPTTTACMTGK